jgi:hypothetical protein
MTVLVGRRAGLFCFACILLAWSFLSFPVFWRTAGAGRAATEIIAGRSFAPELIAAELPALETKTPWGLCWPAAKRANAILRLYLYEASFRAGQVNKIDERLQALEHQLKDTLRCAPSDSYLWLVLFSIENARVGFDSRHLEYLRASYVLGPNEGWISLKRSPVALAMLSVLDEDLSQKALAEFEAMVANGLYAESAAILANANPAVHERVLAGLSAVPLEARRRFADELKEKLPSASVPGVVRDQTRPWK